MANTKKKISITVDRDTNWALKELAKIQGIPVATKAAQMLRDALELQEDLILGEIAERRAKDGTKRYISHKVLWKKLGVK